MDVKKGTSNLTFKQKRFVTEYWECGNASEAARRAGYSVATARHASHHILKKPEIQKALRERQYQSNRKSIANRNEIMEFWTSVMRGEIKDAFDLPASLSDRLKANNELAKRVIDVVEQDNSTNINIYNDIPRNVVKKTEEKAIKEIEEDTDEQEDFNEETSNEETSDVNE